MPHPPHVPNSPIHTRILRESIGTSISDLDALVLLAGLYFFGIKVTRRVLSELWSPDYPLLVIRWLYSGPSDSVKELIEEYTQVGMLPHLDLAAAAATLAGLWDEVDPRSRHAFWIGEFNDQWNEFCTFDSLSKSTLDRLSDYRRAICDHPDVTDVVFIKEKDELTKIQWDWQRELPILSLRGILAFAFCNACRVWPIFKEKVMQYNHARHLQGVERYLAFIERFLLGDDELVPQIPERIEGEQCLGIDVRDMDYVASACIVAHALGCARYIAAYLSSGDQRDLTALINCAADSGGLSGSEDYLRILSEAHGSLPELGPSLKTRLWCQSFAG